MTDNITDVSYCPECRHIVPRKAMTHIDTSKANVKRRLCTNCKSNLIELRKAKAKLPNYLDITKNESVQ